MDVRIVDAQPSPTAVVILIKGAPVKLKDMSRVVRLVVVRKMVRILYFNSINKVNIIKIYG